MDEFYFDFNDLYVNLMVLFSFVNAKVSGIILNTFFSPKRNYNSKNQQL